MLRMNFEQYINTKKGQTSGPGWEDPFVFTGVYGFPIQVTRLPNFIYTAFSLRIVPDDHR